MDPVIAPLPPGYRLLDLPATRLTDVLTLVLWSFPESHSPTEQLESPSPLSWDRVRGIEADGGDDLVGLHASYPFSSFPVPGATLPVAGLTWVGVHPGHRRRGLLRTMIGDHLCRSAARGEPVSALTASEPAIYGRFGYGMATKVTGLSIRRGSPLHPVAGSEQVEVTFEAFDFERHHELIAAVHREAGAGRPNRPGWVTRETPSLEASFLDDHPATRGGMEARKLLVARTAGRPTGYAMFRRQQQWPDRTAAGTVAVRETVALDPATAHALWSRLLDLDLMANVEVSQLTLDDPLLTLLVDLRAAKPRLADNIWIRIIDLPAALAGRQYAGGLDTVIEVTDPLVAANAGRWRLVAEPFADGASVTPTEDAPEISLGIAALGSLYLGGGSASSLAAAGALTATSGEALARFATAFGWPVSPGSSWIF